MALLVSGAVSWCGLIAVTHGHLQLAVVLASVIVLGGAAQFQAGSSVSGWEGSCGKLLQMAAEQLA